MHDTTNLMDCSVRFKFSLKLHLFPVNFNKHRLLSRAQFSPGLGSRGRANRGIIRPPALINGRHYFHLEYILRGSLFSAALNSYQLYLSVVKNPGDLLRAVLIAGLAREALSQTKVRPFTVVINWVTTLLSHFITLEICGRVGRSGWMMCRRWSLSHLSLCRLISTLVSPKRFCFCHCFVLPVHSFLFRTGLYHITNSKSFYTPHHVIPR